MINKKQNHTLRIDAPRLTAQQGIANLVDVEFCDEAEYVDLCLEGREFSGCQANFVIFDRSWFERVRLNETSLGSVRIADSRFDTCDFSNANWTKGTMNRVELIGCKLTGFKAVGTYFSNTSFQKCIAEHAQFQEAEFKSTIFDECDLRKADFQYCDLQGISFRNCDLTGAVLYGAKLVGADFRGSHLEGMKVHANDLRGAIINVEQSLELATCLAGLLEMQVLD